jgi:hypothetical protein
MTAATTDFLIEQGATFRREILYKDSAGAVINLTGYTARMQVRRSKSSSTVLLDMTTANLRLVITPAEGKIVIDLPATLTATFTWPRGVYDLEIESSGGVVTRLLEGEVSISREVTRA